MADPRGERSGVGQAAMGYGSIALGGGACATGHHSVAIGCDTYALKDGDTVINNTPVGGSPVVFIGSPYASTVRVGGYDLQAMTTRLREVHEELDAQNKKLEVLMEWYEANKMHDEAKEEFESLRKDR